jgi:hypothetical protein
MADRTDYCEIAARMGRAVFAQSNPFPFLIGGSGIRRPSGPQRTVTFDADALLKPPGAPPAARPRPMVLAVRKVSEVFPSMITVGRTANNDVLVEDVQVSKFHASFRLDGERIEITDHGSRNGTWVGGARLTANAPPRPVRYGETIRFGTVEFNLVDAAECWDRIRRPRR